MGLRHRRTVARSFLALVLSAVAFVTPAAMSRVRSPQDSSGSIIYVSVSDRRRFPVRDLNVGDFVIKEDGKERQILSVESAAFPPHVAILIDDNGSGVFGYGLIRFAELLEGKAELAIRVVTNQVQTIADFSADATVWIAAIHRAGVRPATSEGGQLLEGIFEAARDLRHREARRPVIVALTVGGDEQSPRLASEVLNELWKSRAALHVIYVESPAVRPSKPNSRPSDLLEGNFNLSRVLGDGPKESGGRRHDVLAMNAVLTEIQQIALDLRNQYVIAYARPSTGNPPAKLQVEVRRQGITVTAPTRAPAR